MRMVYSKALLDHFESPRGVGRLDASLPQVGTGNAGAYETGGVLRLQIQVDQAGTIAAACFKAYGPPALIAAGSWLTQHVQGRRLDEAGALTHQPVAQGLEFAPAQLHWAMLAEDALRGAIRNYKEKQGIHV